MPNLSGGQALVRALMAQGVNTVFGLISIHMMEVYEALYEARDSVRFIGGRHEQAVAYMADGYARASGREGVFFTSTGPGAANCIGAMGEAYSGHSPILHVTSNVELGLIDQGRGAIHEPRGQATMFQHVADWSSLVKSVEDIPRSVFESFGRFRSRPPRPIHLELPVDIQERQADVEILPFHDKFHPEANQRDLDKTIRLLTKARKPIIIAGRGVISSNSTPDLINLAETFDVPVCVSQGGKGAFPADHPLYVGSSVGGRVYGNNPVHQYLSSSDLVLAIGTSLGYRLTAGVGLRLPKNLVHINLDSATFDKNYSCSVAIEGDAKIIMQQLIADINGRDFTKGASARREISQLKQHVYHALVEQGPNQQRTMDTLRSIIPREAIVVFDSTIPAYWGMRGFDVYEPRTFMAPHGWGSIGFGFPAAIGAKAACPGIPVVVITGDGGFQYNMAELATAIQEKLDIIILLFNDEAYGVLKARQETYHNRHFIGTNLLNPDFVRWAEAYNAFSIRTHTLAELARALEEALTKGGTHLIEIPLPGGFGQFA